MNIVYAVLMLGAVAAIFGLILAIASKVFEVKVDPRLDMIRDFLPGANCGGCGFPGCDACAAAIVEERAPVNACPSCTGQQTSRIAAVMGVEVEGVERRVAFVRCNGGNRAGHKFEKYLGITDCLAATKLSANGHLDCSFGCLGLGSCVQVCKFDAMRINSRGVAEVDRDKCTHCMQCATVCPRHIIVDMPYNESILIPCANKDKGAIAKANCSVSCIGCGLCERTCPNNAIAVKNNVARIDYDKCTACGKCVAKCPRKLLINIHDDGRVAPVVLKRLTNAPEEL